MCNCGICKSCIKEMYDEELRESNGNLDTMYKAVLRLEYEKVV